MSDPGGIDSIIDLLTKLAAGDYQARGAGDPDDPVLHAAIVGINMLAEELEAHRAELETRVDARTAELQAAQAELRRSNERLTAFAGQVSHDLRNPLTAVSMSLRMIDEAVGGDEVSGAQDDIGWLVKRALGGATRMHRLIDDLLAFARLGGELVRTRVDLAVVAGEVLEDLAVALAGATVEVRDLPTVIGDPVQLRAVMQNLLANAAKFTRAGDRANVVVAASRIADGWRVEVSDRGPGIAEADRERVFDPLAQVDEDAEGSGIGLTTCRRIMEAHKGQIGLTASPWGGTTAWFELPGNG